jgi:hypothetical protein
MSISAVPQIAVRTAFPIVRMFLPPFVGWSTKPPQRTKFMESGKKITPSRGNQITK